MLPVQARQSRMNKWQTGIAPLYLQHFDAALSGTLAIAFTASLPQELLQEELVAAVAVQCVIHLQEKLFFPGPSTCFIIFCFPLIFSSLEKHSLCAH